MFHSFTNLKDYPTNSGADNPEYSWTINFTNGRKHTLCSALDTKRRTSSRHSKDSSQAKPLSTKRTHLNPAERKRVKLNAYISYYGVCNILFILFI